MFGVKKLPIIKTNKARGLGRVAVGPHSAFSARESILLSCSMSVGHFLASPFSSFLWECRPELGRDTSFYLYIPDSVTLHLVHE